MHALNCNVGSEEFWEDELRRTYKELESRWFYSWHDQKWHCDWPWNYLQLHHIHRWAKLVNTFITSRQKPYLFKSPLERWSHMIRCTLKQFKPTKGGWKWIDSNKQENKKEAKENVRPIMLYSLLLSTSVKQIASILSCRHNHTQSKPDIKEVNWCVTGDRVFLLHYGSIFGTLHSVNYWTESKGLYPLNLNESIHQTAGEHSEWIELPNGRQ